MLKSAALAPGKERGMAKKLKEKFAVSVGEVRDLSYTPSAALVQQRSVAGESLMRHSTINGK